MLSGLSGGTGRQQGEGKQAGGNFNFHVSVCNKPAYADGLYNYYILARNGKYLFFFYKNRPKIGFSRSRVAGGQSFRSVIKAESKAVCSGQLGSTGIRGITSARTRLAVSAFAVK